MTEVSTHQPTRRGTTNSNDRGNSRDREARRAWLMVVYEADVPGYARCYRCGCLLSPEAPRDPAYPCGPTKLTIDRIIPGKMGGTYERHNIRPACGPCNSSRVVAS